MPDRVLLGEVSRADREAARLLAMVAAAGAPVPEGATFRRTYAGRNQRVEGCAQWILVDVNGDAALPLVCSQWPRRYLLARGVTAYLQPGTGDWIIDPA